MQKLDIRFKKEVLCYSAVALMVAVLSIYDVLDYVRIFAIAYFSLFLVQLIVLRKVEKRILSSVLIIGGAFFIADRITDGEFFFTVRVDLIFAIYLTVIAMFYAVTQRQRMVSNIALIVLLVSFTALLNEHVYAQKIVKDWKLNKAIKEELLETYGTQELIDRRRLSLDYISVWDEIKRIDGIEQFENLEDLHIRNAKHVKDFSVLKELTKLDDLEIGNGYLDLLDDVGELTPLKYLEYNYCDYGNGVDGLNYPNLKDLSLQGGKLENLESMRNMEHIEGLDLAYMELDSLKGIEKMTSLKEIRLHSVTIKDTDGLEIPDGVEEIDIRGGDIDGLERLMERYPNIVEYEEKFNFGFE